MILIESKKTRSFGDFIVKLGVKKGIHIILHSSFKKIVSAFPELDISSMICILQDSVGKNGSLIMPTFTYNFKKKFGFQEIYDPEKTPSKVGQVTETFRRMPEVIRTASPTHSFALWGNITDDIDCKNSPASPLGAGSVMEWMANQKDCAVLLLGVDFSSLTFGHYLEIKMGVPWYDYNPWDYLGIEETGLSVTGAQNLTEIPGCSKSFVNFQVYLLKKRAIENYIIDDLTSYILPIDLLLKEGSYFFKRCCSQLLCASNTCPACDARREMFQVA